MSIAVTGDIVACVEHFLGKVCEIVYVLSNIKERGRNAALFEDLEIAIGIDARSIIKGNAHELLPIVWHNIVGSDQAILDFLKDISWGGNAGNFAGAYLLFAYLTPLFNIANGAIGFA